MDLPTLSTFRILNPGNFEYSTGIIETLVMSESSTVNPALPDLSDDASEGLDDDFVLLLSVGKMG
jgi:hypothetical protein